jgi:AcrR family transcriptional regulator
MTNWLLVAKLPTRSDHVQPYSEAVTGTEVDDPPPARRRRRDPEYHRAAILDAARAAFTERGYARATVRDIAQRAGVTHGLVLRQFATKEQLFLAAVPGTRDLEQVVTGDPQTLPERVAHAFVQRMEAGDDRDPFVALIRSAASNENAATRLFIAMQEHSVSAYRAVLPVPDIEVRVELLAAQLIGITYGRYIVKTGTLAAMPAERLAEHLASVLRHILLG